MHKFQGKIFGDYQAIAPVERRNSAGYIFWRLQCLVCGDNKTVSAQALVAKLVKGTTYRCQNMPVVLPVVTSSGVRDTFTRGGPGMLPFRVEIQGLSYDEGALVRFQVVDSVVKFVPSRLPNVLPGLLGRAFAAGHVKLYLAGRGRPVNDKWLVPAENVEWVSRTEKLPPSPVEFETGEQQLKVELGELLRMQIYDADMVWAAHVTCGEQSLLVSVDARNQGTVYPLAGDGVSLFWPEHEVLLDAIWPYLPMDDCVVRPLVGQAGMWVDFSGNAEEGVYAKPQGIPPQVQALIDKTCASPRIWLFKPGDIQPVEPAQR